MDTKEAWFQELNTITAVKAERDKLQQQLDESNTWLDLADQRLGKYASDYAAERAAEGANAVEGPDGALYTIRKARKRKGGAEPVNPYVLEPVKR
jgi:hypothetical protein